MRPPGSCTLYWGPQVGGVEGSGSVEFLRTVWESAGGCLECSRDLCSPARLALQEFARWLHCHLSCSDPWFLPADGG